MSPKRRHEEDEETFDDDEREEAADEDEDDEDGDDDEDTIDLDSAEEEEDDDDDVDDDDDEDDDAEESADDLERKRLFQIEAEEVLESLTLDDVKEVLKENELDVKLAPRLKKLLVEVIAEGDVDSMDDAWEEAVERLEE